ncbi:sugar phosphate isomerase/epimerase family protein [Corynebacterium guangdongense]|uniref:Sugar phosphate isomerase/epimerase n=1 Tax=Corynebacterium guangdongense TaxID=1783348 RepID=A0ABU1ZVU7_9CORY|nr:sugar phosphate isomerase/epimerase family protein [Corynebacterium guangdongense]MDR7328362.1 sugar phosphate isomerase/epimerase [Corynebacterium guangdongense]WJZ16939.1 3-dehydroshikimate dehydratase [Corynebacterium guangdongense]
MWTISGFADEISRDLDEQIALLNALNIRFVEFRSAWGTKVLDLSEEQLATAKAKLDEAGIRLSSVGSDLGKIQITDPFEGHLERTRHGVKVAKFFGAKYIRLFSFFIPEGEDADQYRDEVLRRTREMVALAEAGGVTLLHENEKGIYGDIPRRVADLMSSVDSPHYRAIFDPANYVQSGAKPVDEAYPLVKEYVDYIHVKDATTPTAEHPIGLITPAGQGDGQFQELFATLKEDGFDGFFSIEPHLGDFDEFGGLCGPDLWTDAHTALIDLFTQTDVEWA